MRGAVLLEPGRGRRAPSASFEDTFLRAALSRRAVPALPAPSGGAARAPRPGAPCPVPPGAGPEEAGAGAGAGREGQAQGRATCAAALIAPARRSRRRSTMSSREQTVGTRRERGAGGACGSLWIPADPSPSPALGSPGSGSRGVPAPLGSWPAHPSLGAAGMGALAGKVPHPPLAFGCIPHLSRCADFTPHPRRSGSAASLVAFWVSSVPSQLGKELVSPSPPRSQHRCTASALERTQPSKLIIARTRFG